MTTRQSLNDLKTRYRIQFALFSYVTFYKHLLPCRSNFGFLAGVQNLGSESFVSSIPPSSSITALGSRNSPLKVVCKFGLPGNQNSRFQSSQDQKKQSPQNSHLDSSSVHQTKYLQGLVQMIGNHLFNISLSKSPRGVCVS